uniref:MYCBP-associated protein n=1 Tax=Ceratitis capitata TaxID=7213 RepID=W8B484_CERCA
MALNSFINEFSPPSSATLEQPDLTLGRPGLLVHNRHIIMELVNRIFDNERGNVELSSSHCSSVAKKSSEYSYDNRLKYWKDVLEQRKRVQASIQEKTGKEPAQVLFNRAVTVDERDKQTVRRLMDYAERLNPLTIMHRRERVLPEYFDCSTCQQVQELRETLPKAERDGEKIVEITGLPSVTKEELLGKPKEQGGNKKSDWLRSKVLEQRIGEKREDLERVIEFYPDIDKLQVVGESFDKMQTLRHNADILYVGEEQIHKISQDSICEQNTQTGAVVEQPSQPDCGVRINEHVFLLSEKRSAKYVELEVRFECEPFEKVVKRVLHLENLGKKVLSFEWVHRPYYDKNSNLLKGCDDEFIFENKPFRLISGECMDVVVQFQPRRADITKQKWMLKIDPQFFCRKVDAVVVRLSGKCKPAPDYIGKIHAVQSEVLEKSNTKMVRQITTRLASLTPLIKPPEVICPYKRTLTELELFEFTNPGYRCERYHDIQLLKELHQRLKKPREPAWDLNIETLKALVLRQESADKRALYFNEMISILDQMRGKPPIEFEEKILDNTERERTCYVYVRGIISAGIDEWEELTLTIEEAFLKVAWKEYMEIQYTQSEDGAGGDAENIELLLNELDEDEIKMWLVKELRHRKAFRDTLYMQTYTHLCNFIEDIVSVIESTDIV